jgi:putative ABC transport system permease protein
MSAGAGPPAPRDALRVASAGLLGTGVARGAWLNAGTAREPVAVLGATAATRLGIDRAFAGQRIWLGGRWFDAAGILRPSPLAPGVDGSALIGYVAERRLGYASVAGGRRRPGPPSTINVRAADGREAAAQSLLARSAEPSACWRVARRRPPTPARRGGPS